MSFPMVPLSQSAAKDLDALKLCSSQCWLVNNCQASTKLLINQFWNVTLISEKTCTTISLWAEGQQCSQAFQKDSVRKLQLWPQRQWKSRYSLLKRESSWFGLVVQFCHHCQLSRQSGSQRQNIKRVVQKLFTKNASDEKNLLFQLNFDVFK